MDLHIETKGLDELKEKVTKAERLIVELQEVLKEINGSSVKITVTQP